MCIVGGSIPEVSNNKIYNTCLIINPSGKVVGKHRKVHLFDVNVPGGICFQESETLTGGEQGATYFDVDGIGRIGVGIWYVNVMSMVLFYTFMGWWLLTPLCKC